jgi:hypothetical protein
MIIQNQGQSVKSTDYWASEQGIKTTQKLKRSLIATQKARFWWDRG